jgi:ubiquinone biosynthesis protein UbiJ
MLDALADLLAPPVLERLTLVLNHVLRAEPAAVARLVPHSGRTIQLSLDGWPSLLPRPPDMRWRVTPAGLLEWCGLPPRGAAGAPAAGTSAAAPAPSGGAAAFATPDLRICVDAGNPAALLARALAGERPAVQADGDAAFAADIGWLLANVRWDVAGDLERLFGPVVAHQLHQAGRALARGLRGALDAAAASPWADRLAQVGSRRGAGRR